MVSRGVGLAVAHWSPRPPRRRRRDMGSSMYGRNRGTDRAACLPGMGAKGAGQDEEDHGGLHVASGHRVATGEGRMSEGARDVDTQRCWGAAPVVGGEERRSGAMPGDWGAGAWRCVCDTDERVRSGFEGVDSAESNKTTHNVGESAAARALVHALALAPVRQCRAAGAQREGSVVPRVRFQCTRPTLEGRPLARVLALRAAAAPQRAEGGRWTGSR